MADDFITRLELSAHIEGGYYKRVYQSEIEIDGDLASHGAFVKRPRQLASSIYFLLKEKQVSKLHSIAGDELWFFHHGLPLDLYEIHLNGQLTVTRLGLEMGQTVQHVVKSGTIFGAKPASNVQSGFDFSFVSCVVAPSFDFAEFKLHSSSEILSMHPNLDVSVLEMMT